MAIQSLTTIKNWFKTGLKPTQAQFWDWLDSFYHKNENIPINKVEGLWDVLSNTASTAQVQAITDAKGQPNGYASLGADGKVPLAQLPALGSGSGIVAITDAPTIALLIADANWSMNGVYTGTAITGTVVGNFYVTPGTGDNTRYFFLFIVANTPIRIPFTNLPTA